MKLDYRRLLFPRQAFQVNKSEICIISVK